MLTPSQVQNAKKQAKPYKLADERGMFLYVQPNGSKWWRLKYRRPVTGKENLLSLGVYPDTSLKRAREKRDEARTLLADGIDPGEMRKAEAAADANTFEAVAREWYAKHEPHWSENHAANIIDRLTGDVFPWIGAKPVAKLTAPDILAVLRRVEERGAVETAHRERGYCGQIMRYAIATGRAESDPTVHLRGALTPYTSTHHAAITDPAQAAELMRAIEGFTGTLSVKCALKLAALLFVRPGELRQAEWSEFDLDNAEWNIPAERMKMKNAHLVPLPAQAVAILRELHPLTGKGRYVFPGTRNPRMPLSDAALIAALRRMGFEKNTMTAHGFRAMARTILDEVLGFRPDFIEHQLAHAVKDPNGRAYNRTAHLPERRKMMQSWASYLEALRTGSSTGSNVVPIKREAA